MRMLEKISFLHIAENAFFDEKKRLNVIGVFDEMTTRSLPAFLPKFSIVFGLRDFKGKVAKVSIEAPSKKNIFEKEINSVEFPNVKERTNLIVNFNGLVFREEGKHLIKITVDGKLVGENRDDCITIRNEQKYEQ
jgi:hypothetical protein